MQDNQARVQSRNIHSCINFKMYNAEGKPAQAPPTGKWTTGLCGCFEEPGNCCFTCCCACTTFGRNVEIIGQGKTSATAASLMLCALGCLGIGSFYSFSFRSTLRAKYNLPEEPCMDFCVHYCCGICAICQEHRELKNRGFDPKKGWRANEGRSMSRINQVPPHIAPGMTR